MKSAGIFHYFERSADKNIAYIILDLKHVRQIDNWFTIDKYSTY